MLGAFFVRYWKRYAVGFVFLLLSSWLTLLGPRYLGQIVDDLSGAAPNAAGASTLIWYMILAALGAFATRFVWRNFLIGTSRDMECHLRQQLYEKFLALPPSFYADHKTGDLMAYAINDVNAIRMALGPAMAQLLNGLFLSGTSIWRMATFHCPPLVWGALVPIALAIGTIVFLGFPIRRRFKRVQETFAAVSDRMQESITGIRVIKAFVQEDSESEQFARLNSHMRDVNMDMVRLSALLAPLIQIFFGASVAVSLIVGGAQVRSGGLSLGDFVAFQGYLTAILAPILSVGRIINLYQRGIASWLRMTDILSRQNAPGGGAQELAPIRGGIRMEHLTYTYPGSKEPALRDLNLRIQPGESLGIMGATGSGKSTLIDLLLGLIYPPPGTLYIDGTPMERIPLAQLRDAVGYVPQDDFLFSATVRENLLLFGQGEDEELEAAARTAVIHDTLVALPEGYETRLGERGVNLSGGQRQRLSIARALVRNPRILIFDDALSSVDTRTEAEILAGLERRMEGVTSIVIAHRVSTLRPCTHIVVLDRGRIVEEGSHKQLLALNGQYARQYRLQTQQGEVSA